MLIWSGHGYVLPLVAAIPVVLCLVIANAVGVSEDHAIVVGFVLSAIVTWIIGRRLNDPAKGHPLIDAKTGETIILRERHTVFWIEVQWWAIPCVLAAIGNLFSATLFPDGADPWPVVFVLGLVGMVVGQLWPRPKPAPLSPAEIMALQLFPKAAPAPEPEPSCGYDCPMVLLQSGHKLLLWNVTDRAIVANLAGDIYAEDDTVEFEPGDIKPVGLPRSPEGELVVTHVWPHRPSKTFTFDFSGWGSQSFKHPTIGTVTRLPLKGTNVSRSLLPWRGQGLKDNGLPGRRVRVLYSHIVNNRLFSGGHCGRIGTDESSDINPAIEVPVILDNDEPTPVGIRWEALALVNQDAPVTDGPTLLRRGDEFWLWNTSADDVLAALYGDFTTETNTCSVFVGEVELITGLKPDATALRVVYTPGHAPSLVFEYDLSGTGAERIDHPDLGTVTRFPPGAVPSDPRQANFAITPELIAKADAGDAEAQYELGFNLFWGFPYSDMEEGLRWLKKSAAQNHPAGCRYLGEILFNGDEFAKIEPDVPRAIELFDIAGRGGWGGGWQKLSWAYEHGTVFPRDPELALHYLKLAAEAGETLCAMELADKYGKGDGVPYDLNHVIHWLRIAAERGQSRFGDAELRLGMMYHLGQGTRQDFAEAERWYSRAAALNVNAAVEVLLLGFDTPPQDTEDARDMLTQNAPAVVTATTKRALKGDAEAMIELAMRHIYGRGLPHDPAQATAWLRQAADTGNAEACRLLAQRLENGDGADIDRDAALALYRQGDDEAMVGAGRMLMERGDGAAALAYLDRAAGNWRATACRLVGDILAHGIGVPADPGRAEANYMLATAANDPESMVGLARLWAFSGHRDGAIEQLERAIDQTHWPARDLLEELCPGWGAKPTDQPMPHVTADNPDTDTVIAEFMEFLDGLSGADIRRLIAAVDKVTLAYALKATPEAVRQRLFINMTVVAKADVEFTMEAVGPVLEFRAARAMQQLREGFGGVEMGGGGIP